MALDMTTADAILKELYPDDVLKNLTYQNHPFFAMVPKMENFVGDAMVVPVTIGNPQGRSATFATALANKGNSTVKKFVITHAKDYMLCSVDNLTIITSQDKKGGFTDALKYENDNGIASLSHSLASSLFRNGGGSIGRVGAVSTTSLTLLDINDIVNFDVGMELTTSTTDGTSGSAYTGTATVTDVDRNTGILTTDTNWATQISSIAVNDYIFVAGDFGAKLKGLAAWLPMTAPSATSFFSLDRTTDSSRLAGVRVLATEVAGLPLAEKLLFGAVKLAREGGSPDHCFVNYETFRDLEIELRTGVQYSDVEVAGVGFSGINLRGPKGTIKVIPDQDCPSNRAYMLTMSTWKLCSAGPAVQILDRDGRVSREASSDAYETRMAFYGNLACNAPGWNAVIDLTA